MIDLYAIKSFVLDEEGAATIDFVVMTAAGVATSVALMDSARDILSDLVDEVGVAADAVNVSTSFADPSRDVGSGQDGNVN